MVVWELLTGEIPYKGLEGVAIAFGIGTFTLSLPIPEDCPAVFKELLTGEQSQIRLCFVNCVYVMTCALRIG